MSITVDLWQTFEFDTLNTTNLAANDNCADGTWAIDDAVSKLSTSTSGERATIEAINATADSGTRGLKYVNDSVYDPAHLLYDWASAKSNLSLGFWFKAPTAFLGVYDEHDLCVVRNSYGERGPWIKCCDANAVTIKLFTPEQNYSAGISISVNTWYWITLKVVKNDKSYLRVYDTSSAQVGSEVNRTMSNRDSYGLEFGSVIGGARDNGGTFYYDDLIIDWTDATFPLGPGTASTATILRQMMAHHEG